MQSSTSLKHYAYAVINFVKASSIHPSFIHPSSIHLSSSTPHATASLQSTRQAPESALPSTPTTDEVDVELRVVNRAVNRMRDDIKRLADENVYMVEYLVEKAGAKSTDRKELTARDEGNGAVGIDIDINGDNKEASSEDKDR
ncbi:Periodic tryptophan protein 2 [Beauveria bassiana]|uniref:Periodic tryptophan protein 2 n=1 Tax=Beauveria bassiana TaxID=176275 RepID=A0A2N6NE46_BEABA|nr:Periodic tryptophan protein 2 [Beauveria bassiana]